MFSVKNVKMLRPRKSPDTVLTNVFVPTKLITTSKEANDLKNQEKPETVVIELYNLLGL